MDSIVSTTTRQEFIENIKKWVVLDSQLKIVNEKTKKMRELKQELSKNICEYMERNGVKNNIEISNGELKRYEKKEYSPLTFGFLQTCLEQIIENQEQVDYIIQFLKENREIKTSYDLRRTHEK